MSLHALLRPSESVWTRLTHRIDAESGSDPTLTPRWSDPEWHEAALGMSSKIIAKDTDRNRVSALVRLAPGAEYPPHLHAGVEELFLLSGELWIEGRRLHPGDYNRADAGSAHRRIWSKTGCTCVLISSLEDVIA